VGSSSLQSDHARTWSLDDLARTAGLSRAGFALNFKKWIGVTPMEYLTQWRMHLACELLQQGQAGDGTLADLDLYARRLLQDADRAHGVRFHTSARLFEPDHAEQGEQGRGQHRPHNADLVTKTNANEAVGGEDRTVVSAVEPDTDAISSLEQEELSLAARHPFHVEDLLLALPAFTDATVPPHRAPGDVARRRDPDVVEERELPARSAVRGVGRSAHGRHVLDADRRSVRCQGARGAGRQAETQPSASSRAAQR